jgi:hypothetical protein
VIELCWQQRRDGGRAASWYIGEESENGGQHGAAVLQTADSRKSNQVCKSINIFVWRNGENVEKIWRRENNES